jgi:xylan 1,4-beta-xylosidase
MKNLFAVFALVMVLVGCKSTKPIEGKLTTYCNPIDISYRFCLDKPSRREAADPTMIHFKGKYYLFASKSGGYWTSKDMLKWDFIETNEFPTEEYAPTVVAIGGKMYFLASSETKSTVYVSSNPEKGKWSVAVDSLQQPVWDPALFLDDDGRLYLYWGCSNEKPTYGVEVDYKNNFKFIGEIQSFVKAKPSEYGWEVPGDYNLNDEKAPWIEGSWMTKVNGKYYLQYAGPGTEYKSYADGVYVSDKPLGPFTLQPTNPFCSKPEGFVAGGGHGSSFGDKFGNRWQVGAVSISKKHMFERRLAMFPVFCDSDGTLYSNTKYGDYPMYIPQKKVRSFDDLFTGWMLLSYGKRLLVSSKIDSCIPIFMTDENIRTYWSAKTGNPDEYAKIDLGAPCDVYAIQINFAEEKTNIFGREKKLYHRFNIFCSNDGERWKKLVDRSTNMTDNSHQYIQLREKETCRYVMIRNVEVPGGCFAISDFRIFGKGHGQAPKPITDFIATRFEDDKRKVELKWSYATGAKGYVISYGISKDKLYQHYTVYTSNSVIISNLNANLPYYFTIEAFNENGITQSGLIQNIQ